MKPLLIITAGTALLLGACTTAPVDTSIITVSGGQVQGVNIDTSAVTVFKGIPYAAPPVGELRWRRPQPVEPWDTVLLADHFRAAAFQAAHRADDGNYGREFFWQGDPEFSEDCLYLNVWTPTSAVGHPEAQLPVALWVHGGAYTGGWGFEPEMDGEAWAQQNVILVTINYRLGLFGFLNHPELSAEQNGISGNYGTYDQVAALQWVHDNIAQFGGNPNLITVLGQSAGGASIKNLVASPLSRHLISRAIIQSAGGVGPFIPVEQKMQSLFDQEGLELMEAVGYTSLQQMRAADARELFDTVSAHLAKQPWGQGLRFTPHADGVLLTEDFDASVYGSRIADVPYMVGYTANDIFPLEESVQNFAAVRDSLSQEPTYCYLFARALPGDSLPSLQGAFHSSELWYEFGTLQRSWRPFTSADYDLSRQMVSYLCNFVKNGDPNGEGLDTWSPSTAKTPFFKVLNTSVPSSEGQK